MFSLFPHTTWCNYQTNSIWLQRKFVKMIVLYDTKKLSRLWSWLLYSNLRFYQAFTTWWRVHWCFSPLHDTVCEVVLAFSPLLYTLSMCGKVQWHADLPLVMTAAPLGMLPLPAAAAPCWTDLLQTLADLLHLGTLSTQTDHTVYKNRIVLLL